MNQFFVHPEAVLSDRVRITGEDVNHIRNVLRLRIGDYITVSDSEEREYLCSICELTDAAIYAKIEDVQKDAAELPVEIYLFQGFPKADKMELIIQKTVELGVKAIIPVMTKRSIVKLDEKKIIKRTERYNSIALAAAKQAKRGIVPEVMPAMGFLEALSFASKLDLVLVPYENAAGVAASKQWIHSVKNYKKLGIFIGPEGGFDPAEVDALCEMGGKTITLGHRILRTETAGLCMMSIIMFALEED